jgi:hypothetical protein
MNTFTDDELADVKPQPKAQPVVSDALAKARAAAAAAAAAKALADAQLAEAAEAAAPTAVAQPAVVPVAAAKPKPTAVAEDELDEPAPAKVGSGANQGKTATKPTAVAADGDEDDLDVDFGDEKLATRPNMLNRCRPSEKGKAVRFALLPFIKPKSAKNHFVELPGKKLTARCLTPANSPDAGYCCAKLGEDGELHVAALVVRYTNADSKTGGYEKGAVIEWEVQYVDLTRSNYRAVSHLIDELIEDNPTITVYDIDIVMQHDPDRAFGYQFKRIAQKARWKQNPQLVEEVRQAAEKFTKDDGKILKGRLGKKLSLPEWKALLSGVAAGAEEAKLDDVEDL